MESDRLCWTTTMAQASVYIQLGAIFWWNLPRPQAQELRTDIKDTSSDSRLSLSDAVVAVTDVMVRALHFVVRALLGTTNLSTKACGGRTINTRLPRSYKCDGNMYEMGTIHRQQGSWAGPTPKTLQPSRTSISSCRRTR